MRWRAFLIGVLLGSSLAPAKQATSAEVLDYDRVVHLDAEALTEFGMKDAYEELIPLFADRGVKLAPLKETISDDQKTYSIAVNDKQYSIYSPENFDLLSIDALWGRSAAGFFKAINDQLGSKPIRFYALYGGNDLMGIILTPAEAEAARAALDKPDEWPYLPDEVGPWYGQYHAVTETMPWWVKVTRALKQ